MEIRRIVTTALLILALITTSTTTAAATSCDCGDICVNTSGWWRDGDDFTASETPIQAAVDNAGSGETICVKAGSYTENVVIWTSHLTLRGEGAGVVTVTAASSSDHVFEVIANYVNISGITVTGAMGYSYAGIYLNAVDHCNISENAASNNNHGIDLHSSSNNTLTSNNVTSNSHCGIDLSSSNNNTLASNIANSNSHCGIDLSSSSANILTNNSASNNCYGIDLSFSSSNTLTGNIANSNSCCGIYLYKSSSNTFASNNANSNNHRGIYLRSSSNNTLASNTMSENMYTFDVSGSSLSEYTQNIDTSNTMDGKPIYYWVDQKDRQIPSDAGFVGVVNGTNITVRDLTLRNNWEGVLFAYTDNSRIENVTTSNNYYSIILDSSRNNTLVSNNVSNNKCGIGLSSSSNNTLAGNNANSNNYFGIYLDSSRNNTLANNNAKLNGNHGIYLDSSSNNTLMNNNANSNSNGIYLDSSSNNNMLVNNNATLNNDGICLYESSNNNTLANNNANSNGDYGIYLYESSNNMLTSNNANSNGDYGIRLCDSSDNLIYNNYFNNMNNAHDDGSNQWNTTKTNGINIIGGPFLGGNYWSDYAGVDNDGDGLGDTRTPYNPTFFITYDGDYHPLVPAASLDPTYIPPDPVNLTHTLGNYRVYYTWFPGAGNVTDSYNVNLNGIWMNGTTSTFVNTSVGLEGWANITVYAYNVSGTGTQSSGCVSDSMQAPAPPVCNCTCSDICVNKTGWWRDGCAFTANTTPIQAAVDNATAGETICVAADSYTENVVIRTSHLTLRGEGAGVVTVTAALSSDHVFEVIANYVNISGFTATGTMGYSYAGIYLDNANHCNISENYCSNNYCGIYLHFSSSNMLKNNNADSNIGNGIRLDYSSNNTLAKNNANLNGNGIYLDSSRKNTLTSNNANSNNNYGIRLYYSSENTLASNNASNNNYGIHLSSSSDNTLARNNANLNSYYGIYLSSSSDNMLARNNASNNNYGIFLSFSSDNTLANNTANSNGNHGIYLSSSSDNTLANNTANSNNDGIYLYSSSNNTLASNIASNHDYYGIRLGDSSDNVIYNNYLNNTKNAYDDGNNQWNTTKTNGTNIIGGPFLGGNYWSDYAGVDNDGDGLGDTRTPYNPSDDTENGGDYHPLVMLDNTPPSGITYLENITHARTYLNWTWTDPVDSEFSRVMVYLDGVFQENVNSGVQCYNATLLTPGTTYEISTKTVDTTGNINHTWVNHTATTASTTDTTPPVISNVENTESTTDSVTISWITDENSNSVVRYGTTSGNYTNEESNITLVTLHNITLSGLSEETTYYYMVYSTDASGNTGEGSEYNFTTAAISENTNILIGDAIAAPNGYAFTSIIVNNVTGLGSGSITVTYNSSVVHITNVTSGDGNALAVQDWNVDNSTGSVRIFAQDADKSHNGDVVLAIVNFHAVGEYSDSTPLAISSPELIDYTSYGIIEHSLTNGIFRIIDKPPVIRDAIATPDVILNDNGRPRAPGTNVTVLNATVLDGGSGVANVSIDLSRIGGPDDQVMERIAGTDVWTVAATATEGINLTHELVVTATDGANNTKTSVIGLTVLLRGDVVRDGDLNSGDALYIAKYLVGKESMPSLLVSDISPAEGDERITSADALYLAKYLVGKEVAP